MKTLDLRVRYFQDSTPADVPCRETAFIRREFEIPLPVDETALVPRRSLERAFHRKLDRTRGTSNERVCCPCDKCRAGSGFDNRACPISIGGGAISAT